ncbi:MAG: tryptophan--tRNA ligase [Alphaproteobacteria bacterium]|nr:tryptophan--tRNA ligase [Alphaproteobacteria bacterium]
MKNQEQVMLTGVRPSGNLTLGNYLGAIRNFVSRQDKYKSYIFVADLHAITSPRNPEELRDAVNDCMAMYLACGINPEQTTMFRQSAVLEHGVMGFIMTFQTHMGELSRMTQFKLKSQSSSNNSIDTGLFVYPPLMAADILLYNTDMVPVGLDQQQHVELTRDLAQRFNNRYGKVFNEPSVYIAPIGNKILNLQNPSEKMSKSDGQNLGTIFLKDDLKLVRKKIMSAVTDSESVVRFDEEAKPGISNLISILSATTGESIESIEQRFAGHGYGDFKKAVADAVCDLISGIQTKYQEYKNPDVLNKILDAGAAQARVVASETLDRAKIALGLK